MRVEVRAPRTSKTTPSCPYCRAVVDARERAWRCPRCATVHHCECASRYGRCTLLGCSERYRAPWPRFSLATHGLALLVLLVPLSIAWLRARDAAPAPVSEPRPRLSTPPAVSQAPAYDLPAPRPVDPFATARRLGATTTWRGVAPGSSFVLETARLAGVTRERVILDGFRDGSASLRVWEETGAGRLLRTGAPIEEDRLAGWLEFSAEEDDVLRVGAEPIACRRFRGLAKLADGEIAVVELWLNRHCPVPVRSVRTARGETWTVTLVDMRTP